MHRADLTKLAPISEAHFTDLYGNALKRFRDKYKDADPHVFYVNFNPAAGDERDKTIVGLQSDKRDRAEMRYHTKDISYQDYSSPLYKSPAEAHGDPVGTYAYPIDYVIQHWYDLDYGRDMKFLRVLKAVTTPEKVLPLTEMTQEKFIEVMKRLNLEFSVKGEGRFCTRIASDAIMIYEAIFENESSIVHTRVNSYAKVIFRLVQNDYTFAVNKHWEDEDAHTSDDPDTFADDEDEDQEPSTDPDFYVKGTFKYEGYLKVEGEKTLSAQKQNERLRRAGYDMVVDRAASALEAAIHPNEPEQVIFLTKRSYEVVEVFNMPDLPDEATKVNMGDKGVDRMQKKMAGLVAQSMGDKIIEPIMAGTVPAVINLDKFAHWLNTDQILVGTPINHNDPTMNPAQDPTNRCEAWLTAKGRMIVIAPEEQDGVENTDAMQSTDDAIESARVRPGEVRHDVHHNLRSFVSTSIDKPYHRMKLDYNSLTFVIGVVTDRGQVVYVQSNPEEEADKVAEQFRQRFAAAKPGRSRRITRQVVSEYKKALASFKPKSDPAVAASAASPPSATPLGPDDSGENPAP